MRRSSAYVAVSTALATVVTSYAFIERPNFYSAAVYLSQSSACLIILSNAALVYFAGFMYGLQRLLFGTLRPIEIEQLWERGWIAGTEWLFALSIFRDDFGVAYMASFILLFVSKVWGWMVDGRLDILEQQNPANATKFHMRLLVATLLNILLPLRMTTYCFEEAMYGPKSGIMTMFTFEFGILLIGAISTTLRYALWYHEYRLVQRQLKVRLEEVRREAAETGDPVPPLDDLDIHDLDLPGWEAKSSFQFALDIGTDFLKFAAYLTFFGVLTVLYGLPIYIVRDLYMTGRSFYNRVNDYRQYRSATRNMHNQYPDASVESLASDNTCIVCREDMKPWIGNLPAADQAASRTTGNFAINERQRPKQLPCGHILHFSCLRSWLERQQACPICRRSVLRPATRSSNSLPPQMDDVNRQAQNPQGGPHPDQRPNNPQDRRAAPRGFGFRLGPFRFFFGRLDGEQAMQRIRQIAAGGRLPQAPPNVNQPPPVAPRQGVVPAAFVPRQHNAPDAPVNNDSIRQTSVPHTNGEQQMDESGILARSLQTHSLHSHLTALEDMIRQDVGSLNLAEQRVQCIQWLLSELERARAEVAAHHAGIRPIQISPNGSARLDPSHASSTTASQVILDQQGHVLTTLPEGWTVIPLNPVTSTVQLPSVNASHTPADSSNGLATFATQDAVSSVATTTSPGGPSSNPSTTQGPSQSRTSRPLDHSPLTSISFGDTKTTASESSRPSEKVSSTSPVATSSLNTGIFQSNSDETDVVEQGKGADLTNGASITDSNMTESSSAAPALDQGTSIMGNAPSWSFDNIPVSNKSRQPTNISKSTDASSEQHHSQTGSASSSSKLADRPLQPTIEDLQDEELD